MSGWKLGKRRNITYYRMHPFIRLILERQMKYPRPCPILQCRRTLQTIVHYIKHKILWWIFIFPRNLPFLGNHFHPLLLESWQGLCEVMEYILQLKSHQFRQRYAIGTFASSDPNLVPALRHHYPFFLLSSELNELIIVPTISKSLLKGVDTPSIFLTSDYLTLC